ncbi:MAG: hypothetical protein E6J91_34590 [Deltaproteobacteria bacterium]|nr:MAG: hypothetical protein E6J91_34590 [Deltaproteobacteria bacterium]
MAGGDDTSSGTTVADRPSAKLATERLHPLTDSRDARPPNDPTIQMPPPAGPQATSRLGSSTALTTAADAMHSEEIDRTRLFIRMGWAISAAAIASVPLLHAPRAMSIAFVAAMAIGIAVSAWFHRAFADPARYTERAMMVLAAMCLVNAHVAVLYYGTFTVTPLIVVIGIHFVARTGAERSARRIIVLAMALYAASALAILSGAIADPGVFASDRPVSRRALGAGAGFVLGAYALAYATARSF